MGKDLIVFTPFPFTPFDQESFYFLPVFPGNRFNRAGAVATELAYLATDSQVILPGSSARSAERYTYSK